MKLHHVSIPRAALDAIPEAERTMFILFGHAANELNALVRLSYWCGKAEISGSPEGRGNALVTLTLQRLLSAKLFEIWRLMEKTLFAAKLGKAYEAQMSVEAKQNLTFLKSYFSKTNAIAAVRNQHAFHFSPDRMKLAYSHVPTSYELDMYFGESSLNTLYCFANVLASNSMLYDIEPSNTSVALNQLRQDTLEVHAAFLGVIDAIMMKVIQTYLGKDFKELNASEIEIEPNHHFDDIVIPFFVTVSE